MPAPIIGLALRGLGGKLLGKMGGKALTRKFVKTGAGKLMKEFPERSKALRRKMAHRSAEMALEHMKEKIPKDEAWRAYRKSLEIAEVKAGSEFDAFVVQSSPKSTRTVRNKDASEMLLYVKAHRRLKRVPESVRILEKYNPWTLHTLPFTPKRTDAEIVSRKVSKNQADKVAKRRMHEKHKWRSELSGVGVRPQPIRPKEAKVVSTTPDVGQEAMRLEFGIGQKPAPHWRPAITHVKRAGAKTMMRDPQMKAALSNPNFTGWKRWGKIKTNKKIGESEAGKYKAFGKKLGIR
jgi:hypothetical protein